MHHSFLPTRLPMSTRLFTDLSCCEAPAVGVGSTQPFQAVLRGPREHPRRGAPGSEGSSSSNFLRKLHIVFHGGPHTRINSKRIKDSSRKTITILEDKAVKSPTPLAAALADVPPGPGNAGKSRTKWDDIKLESSARHREPPANGDGAH